MQIVGSAIGLACVAFPSLPSLPKSGPLTASRIQHRRRHLLLAAPHAAHATRTHAVRRHAQRRALKHRDDIDARRRRQGARQGRVQRRDRPHVPDRRRGVRGWQPHVVDHPPAQDRRAQWRRGAVSPRCVRCVIQ